MRLFRLNNRRLDGKRARKSTSSGTHITAQWFSRREQFRTPCKKVIKKGKPWFELSRRLLRVVRSTGIALIANLLHSLMKTRNITTTRGQTMTILRIVRKARKISHHIQATMNHFFHYMECFAAKLSELKKKPILPSGFAKKLLSSRFIIHKTFSSLKTQAHFDGSLFTGIPGKVIIIPPVLVSGFQTNFSS